MLREADVPLEFGGLVHRFVPADAWVFYARGSTPLPAANNDVYMDEDLATPLATPCVWRALDVETAVLGLQAGERFVGMLLGINVGLRVALADISGATKSQRVRWTCELVQGDAAGAVLAGGRSRQVGKYVSSARIGGGADPQCPIECYGESMYPPLRVVAPPNPELLRLYMDDLLRVRVYNLNASTVTAASRVDAIAAIALFPDLDKQE